MGKYSSFWFRIRRKNVSSGVKAGSYHKLKKKAQERLESSVVGLLPTRKVKRTRLYRGRVNVGCTWQQYLDDPLYKNPVHYKGRNLSDFCELPSAAVACM